MKSGKQPDIVIQKVDLSALNRYNTCNYPVDSIETEHAPRYTYEQELQKTGLEHYVHHLNELDVENGWKELKLSERTLAILKKFNDIGWRCGRLAIPSDSETDNFDELWSCVDELSESNLFDGTRWFFRFSRNSPKDGMPSFPVVSEYDVLEKVVTSARASFALEHGNDTLYFRKFRDTIEVCNEFRVFIHKQKITAISTYVSEFTDFTMLPDDQLCQIADKMHEYWQNLEFLDVLPDSYTMDLHVPDDVLTHDSIYLIEFNSFGYHMAAGSCLFDWIDDYDSIYSDGEKIVFRLANMC